MTKTDTAGDQNLRTLIDADLQDTLDEELEMKLDDRRLEQLKGIGPAREMHEPMDRSHYFRELLRLQGDLVKLQDWIQHNQLKVVVIFEGRDSAGKGGVIKRITQRLNPRVCRVAALPAPSERERTQWYFQRYVSHLPAGGEIVLFDRSWYNRAGVERVMEFCTEEQCEEFFRSVPDFERMLVRSGILLIKYWFSITDEEQQFRFLMRIHDPLKQWKLSPMDVQSRARWERYTRAKGRDASADPHSGSTLVGGRSRRQKKGAAQLHFASTHANSLRGCSSRDRGAPRAIARPSLSPRRRPHGNVCSRPILILVRMSKLDRSGHRSAA